MNTILGRLTLLMGISVCCVAAFSQQGISSNVISDLKSKDWKTRLSAYEQVKAVKTPDVGSVLLELLDRETQFMRTTRAESKGRLSVSDKYGESYLDYYHDLQDSVSRTADWKDQRQLCVLAQSAYSPESTFSKRLVDKGGTLLTSCLLAMAKPNADENDRYMAIPVLVQLSAATQELPPSIKLQIQQVVRQGLADPSVGVRLATVRSLGRFGTAEMIPLLQNVANSDPQSRRLDNGEMFSDVRDTAAKAIQSIRSREQPNVH